MEEEQSSGVGSSRGTWGERLISDFFHDQFSAQLCFPNPKTTNEAEVADVLIWWNRRLFLVEVKTRSGGGKSPESWASTKIREGVLQLRKNYQRMIDRETVNLHNVHYQVQLQHEEIRIYHGILVLLCDEPLLLSPREVVPDIYTHDFPIHVLMWDDLKAMVQEVDTLPDLSYYLSDRLALLRRGKEVPLGRELHCIGLYKMGNNKFTQTIPTLAEVDVWSYYRKRMVKEISRRDRDNRWADLFDHVVGLQPPVPRRYGSIPIGVYWAWEFGSLARRARAIYGKKLKSVEKDFCDDRIERLYATHNQETGNWHVFFFSRGDSSLISQRLERLVRLKLIKELKNNNFEHAAYGLGFHVSTELPPKFTLVASAFNGVKEAHGFSQTELDEAYREFGHDSKTSVDKIVEFPGE